MKKEKGLLAVFNHPDPLLEAIKKVRKTGIKKMDAQTPFAIHGIEAVMGIKRSWIPWATLFLGLTGWCLGFLFQAWTHSVAWPLIIGGKPYISWSALIPITFESMILIGGVGTVIILFAVCRLPSYSKQVLDPRLTDDRFGLFIDESDSKYDESKLKKILKECHAEEVKNIY